MSDAGTKGTMVPVCGLGCYVGPMGTLEHKNGQRVILPSHTLVGRQRSCFLILDGANASSEHAVVAWQGSHWSVRDLGSRNGTLLDDQRVPPATVMPLNAGSRLVFGDPSEAWTLVEDAPPEPTAIDLVSRVVRVGKGGMLALPEEEHPSAVLYESGGTWTLEQDQESRTVSEGALHIVAGSAWMVFLPTSHMLTPHQEAALSVQTSMFRFFTSRNAEHVRLVIAEGGNRKVFEAREHYYLLLVLARHRLEQRDLSPEDCGWMSREELSRRLRADSNAIDVAIHRNRRRLEEAGVLGAASVVQVRRGERRFGTDKVEIIEE